MTEDSDKIIDFPGVTTLTTPVPKVLATAAGAGLQDVVVLGWKSDGELYFASSTSDGAEVLWTMKQAEYELLAMERK